MAGELRWIHEKCEHQQDTTGRVVRSIGIAHEITEQKEAEMKLHRRNTDLGVQEEELRAQTEELAELNANLAFQYDLLDTIFATVPHHVSVWDGDGRCLWMNNQAAREIERLRDAPVGKTWQEIGLNLATMERFMPDIRRVIATGESFTDEVMNPDPYGVQWCSYSINRMSGGEQVVIVSTDITWWKEAEPALKNYAERLRMSNEKLQRFAYVASHDLHEPLRSIVSFSQLIDRRYRGKLDSDVDEFLGYIAGAGRRMQALILDLLQVSRTRWAPDRLCRPMSGGILADAIRSLKEPLAEAGGTMVVEAMPTVMVDAAQLEQVFTNLIGNAIKYRRPEVPLMITVSAGRHEDWWEFAIADSGIGIESEYYELIFEMFRRLHTQNEYEGTGIGLAIVKKIVERHGGRVWVESMPNRGSTFFFTMPAV